MFAHICTTYVYVSGVRVRFYVTALDDASSPYMQNSKLCYIKMIKFISAIISKENKIWSIRQFSMILNDFVLKRENKNAANKSSTIYS